MAGFTPAAIRYRVWDPVERWMLSMDMENGPILYRGDVYRDWRAFEDGVSDPRLVFLLSTGLHDADGREVFEGDHLQIGNSIAAVFRSDEMAAFIWNGTPLCQMSIDVPWRIVGNVYEDA